MLDGLLPDVTIAVDNLFDMAWRNQTHPQDLLLVDQHGFYSDKFAGHSVRRLSGYMIGPGFIGPALQTFYGFIDWYRKSHVLSQQELDALRAQDTGKDGVEHLMAQMELSIYLRFWEVDSLLKRYYQLTSLACAEPYDWHFEIPVDPRRGSKNELIREKIRDRVKDVCPAFYALVKDNYLSQLRNAIAHSHFLMIGRSIRFLNFSEDPQAHSPLRGMTFDEWYRRFHTTLLLHNATICAFQRYREDYKQLTLRNGNRIEIRIRRPDGSDAMGELGYCRNNTWVWRENLLPEDL